MWSSSCLYSLSDNKLTVATDQMKIYSTREYRLYYTHVVHPWHRIHCLLVITLACYSIASIWLTLPLSQSPWETWVPILISTCQRKKNHVTEVCCSSYYNIGQIGKISRPLTRDACASAVRSAILSRIDYSNALLEGLAVTQLAWRQNIAARLIALKRKNENITPLLCDLHWLPLKLKFVF